MICSSAEISDRIWRAKYRQAGEASVADSWRRIARTLAAAEPRHAAAWEPRFYSALQNFNFLPGGRIQAGAGTDRTVTLFNCFVMGPIEDSIPGIFGALAEGALTMQQGGGVGYDFSTLRPKGSVARGAGTVASGPVSFMRIWDAMCATIQSTGARRGAMMATLRGDHPDIEAFIEAKRAPGELRHFNLSVQVGDDLVSAARSDADWPLVFPAAAFDGEGETVERLWPGAGPGAGEPKPCRVLRTVRARELWDRLLRAAYDCAEPGVLFIDRINRLDNLGSRERITATNPCGEIPLPPYGACDLGSINLARLVRDPFTRAARIDEAALKDLAALGVRMLDNVIDVSPYPLEQQARAVRAARRIGLGITGLADALIMLGLRYDEPAGRDAAAGVMRTLRDAAYRASAALAREKGPFPLFDRDRFLEASFVRALPDDIRAAIAADGARNSHLLAIAPAATISLMAGNVSSGLEPVYAGTYARRMLAPDNEALILEVIDYALELWRTGAGAGSDSVPSAFVTAGDLSLDAHLEMQAALQPFVDNSISKTLNAPESCSFDTFRRVYDLAYDLGLKGCTVFRPNPTTGSVLGPEPSCSGCDEASQREGRLLAPGPSPYFGLFE
jgi:ribonucleoside-diphosphate reductase alpha chain